MQHIPLSTRIRALFTRDKEAFWFHHFTDEEKELRRMDVWELAKVINEIRVRKLASESEKLIVAEHLLNIRLARIQATASWGSGILGFLGAIVGAALSVSLTIALQDKEKAHCTLEHTNEKQAVTVPIRRQQEVITKSLTYAPRNPDVKVAPATRDGERRAHHSTSNEQPNVTGKP